jgi:hypothetical protein
MLVAIAIVIIALLLSASHSVTARTFALGAESNGQVAVLRPGAHVCEGPVSGAEGWNAVGIWGGGIGGPATMTITARDERSRETLASGTLRALGFENGWTARLDRTIQARRPVRICLHQDTGTFTLSGAPAVRPHVVMSGKPRGQEFSLVLLNKSQRSLLGWLPTVFQRASLWRPSWVGPWTFWALLVGVLGTFGLAVMAVVRAAEDDELPPPSTPSDPPPGDVPSEPRQDHPQPVS